MKKFIHLGMLLVILIAGFAFSTQASITSGGYEVKLAAGETYEVNNAGNLASATTTLYASPLAGDSWVRVRAICYGDIVEEKHVNVWRGDLVSFGPYWGGAPYTLEIQAVNPSIIEISTICIF